MRRQSNKGNVRGNEGSMPKGGMQRSSKNNNKKLQVQNKGTHKNGHLHKIVCPIALIVCVCISIYLPSYLVLEKVIDKAHFPTSIVTQSQEQSVYFRKFFPI